MINLYFIIFFSSAIFDCISAKFPTTVAKVSDEDLEKIKEKSKEFWTDQFQIFEENGFTEKMIVGAKEFYFGKKFHKH